MKINQLFPRKYATGEDLTGKDVTLIISSVVLEEMHTHPGARPEQKPVVYFERAGKGIILTAPLAKQIAEITKADDTDNWPGKKITIYPVPMVVAGQARIAIRAKAPVNGTTPPPDSMQDEPEEE